MRELVIRNPTPIITANPAVLQAAMRILIAGGLSVRERDMRIASGASRFVWSRHNVEIRRLVHQLEGGQ